MSAVYRQEVAGPEDMVAPLRQHHVLLWDARESEDGLRIGLLAGPTDRVEKRTGADHVEQAANTGHVACGHDVAIGCTRVVEDRHQLLAQLQRVIQIRQQSSLLLLLLLPSLLLLLVVARQTWLVVRLGLL